MLLPPLHLGLLFLIINTMAVTSMILYLLGIFSQGNALPQLPFSTEHPGHRVQEPVSQLAQFALDKVLSDASPIFGLYSSQVDSNISTWMKTYPDETLLVHMNIPGTHDAATWNYSSATQHSLEHITTLVDDRSFDPDWFRCQDKSMIDMLSDGIRAFDLRYAYDVTNSTLVFWHGPSLQSETATVDDVLFGFYQWLDANPSETVLLSFQYEGSTSSYSTDDAGVQLLLYNALTSPAARHYIDQRHALGTLGESRGKIVLLRRFDLDRLPLSYTASLPGLHFSPLAWTDNGDNITLTYDSETSSTAYIEDYYTPLTAANSSAEENIRYKVNATEAHLTYAASNAHSNDLFWSFASSTNIGNTPPDTPRTQALGNGSLTPEGGVNQQLVSYLKTVQGKRLGIVMFDFYEQPQELLPLFLGLLPPKTETKLP